MRHQINQRAAMSLAPYQAAHTCQMANAAAVGRSTRITDKTVGEDL
jgi:hypothetical protein